MERRKRNKRTIPEDCQAGYLFVCCLPYIEQGSWTGIGTKAPKHAQKEQGTQLDQEEAAKRKDAKKRHVILSEKGITKV